MLNWNFVILKTLRFGQSLLFFFFCLSAYNIVRWLQSVSRPRGGINEKLRWLPVNLHKRLEAAAEWIRGKPFRAKKLVPFPAEGKGSLGSSLI